MQRVLLTGVGGYVGIPLCAKLIENGFSVIGLDRFFFGIDKLASLNTNENLILMKGDLRSFDLSYLKDVDMILDLAGLSNDATAEIDPNLTISINYKGAIRLIDGAKKYGVKRYIYSSSASVYGAGTSLHLKESDKLAPQTAYARSKTKVEQHLRNTVSEKFETVILRNATIFGLAPRMRFDLAVNIMTMRAWKERLIYIMGGGEQWRPFVHVNDVVNAFLLALKSSSNLVSGEIFNVGSNDLNYTIKALANHVIDFFPETKIHQIPDDPDQRSYNLNFDKINSVLGYQTQFTVPDGIKEIKLALEQKLIKHDEPTYFTLNWYKSLLEWEKLIKSLSYNGKIL